MTKLLLVDDDRVNRAVVRGHLEGEGYEFIEAGDGQEMLDLVQSNPPKLILLDIEMPRMDGITACGILKESEVLRDIPVIIMTATNNANKIGQAFTAGAADFIVKPINKPAVTWRVRAALERSALIHELESARIAAESASRSRSEFLANMSHEIRTPMTAILGFADYLGKKLEKPNNVDAIQTIKKNGHYLLELINDILDLSKIEACKLQIEKVPVAVQSIVVEVRDLLRERADAKGIPLVVELAENIPQTVHTDPVRLRQILINLISNAIKFTQQGSVRIVTRFYPDSSPARLQLEVIDTGMGISQEQLSQIFRAFTQADSSTTRRFGGTGLGLTITKRLVELLGGDIHVTSELEHGSTFTVTLPVEEIQQPAASEEAEVLV